MRIVHQSVSFSPASLACPFPLLAAPPPLLVLPAPKIAGLLPARVPVQSANRPIEIVREEVPGTLDELMAQLGPIRSAEEMDAEIVDMILTNRGRIHAKYGLPAYADGFGEVLQ